MKVLLLSLSIFFISFLLHLVIWKIHLPRNQTKALLQIFYITFITCIITLLGISKFIINFAIFVPENITEYLHICLFFTSYVFAYIIFYSVIEADSPTLVIVMNIARTSLAGLDKEEFLRTMTDELLIKPRIQNLLTAKMVYMNGDKYKLTVRGILFINIFILYCKLLNARKGG